MAQVEQTVTAAEPIPETDDGRKLSLRTTVGVFVAVILALGVRTVAVALDPAIAELDPFMPGAIVGTTVVAGAGAAVVYAALVRLMARPVQAFLAVAAVVFLGMLLPVFLVAPDLGVTGAAQGWLVGMHLAVALPIVIAVANLVGEV